MTVVRTRLVQMEMTPGAPRTNTRRMLEELERARADKVALVVFPELAVPGCLLGDEWERSAFLRECEACGEELRAASRGLVAAFGNVATDWRRRNEDGRVRKYNALFLAEDGQWLKTTLDDTPFVVKTLLPNYRGFDDARHFCGMRQLALERGIPPADLINPVVTRRAGRLGVLVCEDAWDDDYEISPGRILAGKGSERLIVASCSPFSRGKPAKRDRVCSGLARATGLPVLHVNSVGVQDIGKTVYTFDGGSGYYDAAGGIDARMPPFKEGSLTCEVPCGATPFAAAEPAVPSAASGTPAAGSGGDIGMIAQALHHGTSAFMQRLRIGRVVVGISGGIDSAVAAALYARLVPPENLLLVGMPGVYTSRRTQALGRAVARNLGVRFAEAPIAESVALTRRQFDELVVGGAGADDRTRMLALDEAAMENVQARDRGARILAAAAAAFGGVISCNANKSEITVGYGTLYGDILGWLAMLGDLWKGDVYALGHYLNASVYGREVIPHDIFGIVPSAELGPAQDIDKGLGDPLVYPYHDCLFRSWVERWERATPEDNLEWYLAGELERQIDYGGRVADLFPDAASFIADLERWWNLHQGLAVAKRLQAPPVLAVSRRAFGFDLREAQLGPRYSQRYQELRRQSGVRE